MHRTCPRFTRQAFVKSILHIQDVPYQPYMNERFNIAYDAYLEMMYRVDERCDAALGRNIINWRMKNVCPPCTYVLEGEDELRFSLIASIDGNSSLKLVGDEVRAGRFYLDDRRARTDMWVSRDDVNIFNDGVCSLCKDKSTVTNYTG